MDPTHISGGDGGNVNVEAVTPNWRMETAKPPTTGTAAAEESSSWPHTNGTGEGMGMTADPNAEGSLLDSDRINDSGAAHEEEEEVVEPTPTVDIEEGIDAPVAEEEPGEEGAAAAAEEDGEEAIADGEVDSAPANIGEEPTPGGAAAATATAAAVAVPALPIMTDYTPAVAKSYEEGRKSSLSPEEELVWWKLYMQSTNRLEAHSRAPQNVWTVEERRLIESVSDAGLEELRGRLLTLLSGVEYSLWERTGEHQGSHPHTPQTLNAGSGAAPQGRLSVASRRVGFGRYSSSQPPAAYESSETSTRRRRLPSEHSLVARNSAYVPRSSVGELTPVKGTHLSEARLGSTAGTPRPASRASLYPNSYTSSPAPKGRRPPTHTAEAARGSAHPHSAVRRGSHQQPLSPSASTRRGRAPSTVLAERPPFDNSIGMYDPARARASSRRPALDRSQSSALGTPRAPHTPRTPRTARRDISDLPEPAVAYPTRVHTRRLDTVNPLRRNEYTPRGRRHV